MNYKLLDTGQGLVENQIPIFYDIEGNIELSFLLPAEGRYFGLFTNMTGQRRQLKVEFNGNTLTVPQDFKLPGIYLLSVIQIDEKGNILKSWDCEPFRIRSLDKDLRDKFEVTGAASEEDTRELIRKTLEELINLKASYTDLTAKLGQVETSSSKDIKALLETIKKVQDENTTIIKNQKILQENLKGLKSEIESLK